MSASRYMHEHGASAEDLARVAVKNSHHGALNPRAYRRRALALEEVLASRMIADPLTLYQCAGLSDAAAAVVLGARRRDARDVHLRASALRAGRAWDHASEHVWGWEIVAETARDAYAAAGIEPTDVDVVELHDAFTIGEIVTIEALGLREEGTAPAAIAAGELSLGGRMPVNPSGGLLSRGHPLGATGVAQTAEVVWQLRGEAGSAQVDRARIGLLETMGGGAAGLDGNGCVGRGVGIRSRRLRVMQRRVSPEPGTRGPLDGVLRSHGGRMTARHGRCVAADFGSATSEAAVCLKTVGICDRSDRATFEIRGGPEDVEDALTALDALAGRVWWTRTAAHRAIVRCEQGEQSRCAAVLLEVEGAAVADITDRYAAIGVVGPFAVNLLRAASLGAYEDEPLVLYTGPDAFEVLVEADAGPAVWSRLLHAGASFRVACVGLDALEHLAASGRMRPAVDPIVR